jgi:hypothetical protein
MKTVTRPVSVIKRLILCLEDSCSFSIVPLARVLPFSHFPPVNWRAIFSGASGTDFFHSTIALSCDICPCRPQANLAIMAEAVTLGKPKTVRP